MNSSNELLTNIESARMWGYFHKDWLLQIRVTLREQLPTEYRVFVESEAVIVSPDPSETGQVVLPDISVTQRSARIAEPSGLAASATATVVEAEEPCEIETHYSLVIRRTPGNRVVAAIELLSPSDKGVGNRLDEQRYLRKRDDYLDAGISLLEIDTLLKGRCTLPAAIKADLEEYDRIAWTASHEAGRRRYRGWGSNNDDSLPVIDWQVDSERATLIDAGRTLEEAAAFNDWSSLLPG